MACITEINSKTFGNDQYHFQLVSAVPLPDEQGDSRYIYGYLRLVNAKEILVSEKLSRCDPVPTGKSYFLKGEGAYQKDLKDIESVKEYLVKTEKTRSDLMAGGGGEVLSGCELKKQQEQEE